MPLSMKQSVLNFFSPSKRADAIVVADSDKDDGLATPPPHPATKLSKRSNGVVVELIQGPPRPEKMAKSVPSSASTGKNRETPKKKAPRKKKSDNLDSAQASSLQEAPKGKGEAGKANLPVTESILCHQHRHACSSLLRCTCE